MAISFSKNQIKYAQKKFYGKLYFTEDNLGFIKKLINKILIFIYLLKYSLINFKRSLINFKTSDSQIFNFSLNIQQDLLYKYSLELKNNNFTYIENFLSKESHDHLLKIFPNINYFKHNKKIIKHYNSNKEWSYKTGFYNRKKNNSLYGFCKYIQSNEFKYFYNRLIAFEKKIYNLSGISSSMIDRDCYLIPHIDGIIENKDEENNYNFIYFVDGYENPILGGATCLYKDNEFKTPILIPTSLKNSLLVYNQCKDFYHGFNTVRSPKGVYRKAINFQIMPLVK